MRPASLFPSSEVLSDNHEESMDIDDQEEHQENDRVNSSIVVVKQEGDENDRKSRVSVKSEATSAEQIKQEKRADSKDKKVENGKASTGERWNREETESSSDENSVDHGEYYIFNMSEATNH